jgi:hypothetical protein
VGLAVNRASGEEMKVIEHQVEKETKGRNDDKEGVVIQFD